ncbi:MAG: NYN domain-containing protein [Candidatus Omnitrophica bacterium]|nr:NYN domain-containing protein [Candidatus Omnitrophota bacterium]
MSLHYLIDGYNVLHKINGLADKELSDGRQELLDIIKRHNLCGRNKVTVVFDGRSDVVAPPHKSSFVVLFSEGEPADNLIIRLASKDSNPRRVVVVTDDKEIRFKVGSSCRKVMSVSEFTGKMSKRKTSTNEASKTKLEDEDEQKITDELEKKWLGDEG